MSRSTCWRPLVASRGGKLPPGNVWPGVMFPVVAKVVTGQEREPSGQVLGAAAMRIHISGLMLAMGQVGAEVEALERAQKRGHDPECNQPPLGNSKQVTRNVEGNRKDDDLLPADVLADKA